MDNFKQKTISAFKWHTFFKVLSQVITWGITIALVRILKPEDYGLMGMAMILIGFIELFNGLGLGAAIIQKDENKLDHRLLNSVFWLGLIVALVLYGLICVSAPVVAFFYEEGRLTLMIRILGTGLIIGALRMVSFNMLTKQLRFKQRGMAEFSANILTSVVTLIAAVMGMGVFSLVLAFVLRECILTLGCYFMYPFLPSLGFSLKNSKQILGFGGNITLSRVLWYFYSSADNLIIGKLMGKTILGYYSVAFQLASLPVVRINQYIREVTFPAYSYLHNQKKDLKHYFLKNISIVAMIIFPALFGLFIVAGDFFDLFLGQEWAPSIPIFQIMCVAGIFKSLYTQHAPVLAAVGRPEINMHYNIILIIAMPLAFLATAQYGMFYVALNWATLYPVVGFYTVIKTNQLLGISIKEYLNAVRIPLFGCLTMLISTRFLLMFLENAPLYVRFPLICFSGVLVYMAVLFGLMPKGSIKETLAAIRSK